MEQSHVSVLFFAIAACILAGTIFGLCFLFNKRRKMDRAWVEVDLDNLSFNVRMLSHALPKGCSLMAVIKANAYGHGDIQVARHLQSIGIGAFAVATIDEGICLRKHGIRREILILGYTDVNRARELSLYRLSQTVTEYKYAQQLNDAQHRIQIHIKVDTGMHRLGESYSHTDEIADIFRFPNLRIRGIYTHLCVADSSEFSCIAFTKEQLKRFYSLLNELFLRRFEIPKTHIQSSYVVLNYPGIQCDFARIGIALYGVHSAMAQKNNSSIDLRPVLSLKARVVLVRALSRGETVGYGRESLLQRDACIAVLSIGYADGIPRCLSNGQGRVLIHGRFAPIVGRICMDQLMVDVTEINGVQQGDIATLIGKDGDEEICAERVAEEAGTITNELLSRLGRRLERIYLPAKYYRRTPL